MIATSTDVSSRRPDLFDLHFYETPEWFAAHTTYFDTYSRRALKVLVGEYAARTDGSLIGRGPATLGTFRAESLTVFRLAINAGRR